jgi:hypothetical protein
MSGRKPDRQGTRGSARRSTGGRDTGAIARQVITLVLLGILAATGIATFALQSSDPGPVLVGGALVVSAIIALAAGRIIRLRGR